MEPATIAGVVAAVIAAAVAAWRKATGRTSADAPTGEREASVLLDRIEDLTCQLATERERSTALEAEVARLTAERDALDIRVGALEAQLSLVLTLLRPGVAL